MLAYLGSPELKTQMLALADEHRKADHIVRGTYYVPGLAGQWTGGCAVGCTLESARRLAGEPLEDFKHGNHAAYETYLGIPRVLARLEDGIFEGLEESALDWPARFLGAICPGADLSMVWPRFAHWLLTNPDGGVQTGVKLRPAIGPSIAHVAELYQRWIDGSKPSDTKWRKARSAASAAYSASAADASASAAAAAAYSAASAYSAYASAAYSASAAYAADAAADAAAAAAGRAARVTERQRQADKLIELLEAA